MCFFSCKKKTNYGTSIAIENQLNDSLFVIIYPKETSYSYMEHYELLYNESENIYWNLGQDQEAIDIIQDVFDSIVIKNQNLSITFSKDTVIGCKINIYHDSGHWKSKIVEYEFHDNLKKHPHQDIVYTFSMTDELLIR